MSDKQSQEPKRKRAPGGGRKRTVMSNLLAHYLSEETCRHTVEETAGIIGSNKNNVVEYRDQLGRDGLVSVWTYRPAPEDDLGGPDRVAVRVSLPLFRYRVDTLYGKPKENSVKRNSLKTKKNKLDGTEIRAAVPYDDLPFMRLLRYWAKFYDAYHKAGGREVAPFVAGARDRADAKRLVKYADARTVSAMVRMFLSAEYSPPEPLLRVLWLQRNEVLKAVKQKWSDIESMKELEERYGPDHARREAQAEERRAKYREEHPELQGQRTVTVTDENTGETMTIELKED